MDPHTPRHPIRIVARRTGLSQATLRAWERRYRVVDPSRTETGRRLYSDADIAYLDCLRELTELGRSISSLSELSRAEALDLLREERSRGGADPSQRASPHEAAAHWVEEGYRAILQLDAGALDGTLRRASFALGARAFLDEVALPLLGRIGEGWEAGALSPAKEHFGSDLIERVVHNLTPLPAGEGGEPRVVFATLQGERHGLGARLAAAAAVGEGWHAVYLGTDLPAADIAETVLEVDARAVAISVVSRNRAGETLRELALLRDALLDGRPIFLGGRGAGDLPIDRLPPGIRVVSGLDGLREELARLRR